MRRHPPDVLITTPESLYLMLTSQAQEILTGAEWVIVDEIHAVAGSKRGAHLALSLERLAAITAREPQRIGLSATQRPLEEIGRFLVGSGREVEIVDAGRRKTMEITVEVPVEDMADLARGAPESGPAAAIGAYADAPRRSIWPAIYPRLLELIRQHRSTIVFVNSRRLAERLAARLNELAARQSTLTARERDVLARVVAGRLNKQIADELGMAERTVKAHRAQVMEKMKVSTLAELVELAAELRAARSASH